MPVALLRGTVLPLSSLLLFIFTAAHLYKPSGLGGGGLGGGGEGRWGEGYHRCCVLFKQMKTLSLQIRHKLRWSLCHQSLNPPLRLQAGPCLPLSLAQLFLKTRVLVFDSLCSGLLTFTDNSVANTSADRTSLHIPAEK